MSIELSLQEQIQVLKLSLIAEDPNQAIPFFLHDAVTGNLIRQAQIHIDIQNYITENQYPVICVSRNHGKSEQSAIGRVLFEIGNNPNIRVKIFSESYDIAQQRMTTIKTYIEKDDNYHLLYPHIKPSKDWSNEKITVQRDIIGKEPTLMALGIETAATGGRADLIIADDICGEKSSTSKAHREMVIHKYTNTLLNLLEPESRLIYIATPWHLHDLTMKLKEGALQKGKKIFWRFINDNLDPIWAEKWTTEKIMQKREKMIEVGDLKAFELGWQGKPTATEDIMFDVNDLSNNIFIGDPVLEEKIDNSWIRIMGIDLAIGDKTTSDYTVIMVAVLHPKTFQIIPVEIVRKKMQSPDTVREILRLQDRWNCQLIRVENNAYQKSCEQWVKENSTKPIPIQGMPSSVSKIIRANLLSVHFRSRGWKIYNHQNPLSSTSTACPCSTCAFIKELKNFPNDDHDDTVDCAGFLFDAAKQLTNSSNKPMPEITYFKLPVKSSVYY